MEKQKILCVFVCREGGGFVDQSGTLNENTVLVGILLVVTVTKNGPDATKDV